MSIVNPSRPDGTMPVNEGEALTGPEGPLLTCLLPVRNAAHELPGFFASLRGYCDAVVALDDGSTDDTLALLEAEPLVKAIVRNPVREGYAAWNDASNRNRLLRAAADLRPRWLLSLDADERIDAEDGQALRAFLQGDAVPGLAYGFRNASMRLDTSRFWPRYIWVYRLFHFERGQRFPRQKLHFVPIPTSIPDAFRVKTTIRIQHLGELTAERRLARFAKYLDADPARRFQDSYTASIEVIDEQRLHQWLPRPPSLPVLMEQAEAALQHLPAPGQPAITVIVLAQHGAGEIRDTISSIVCAEEVEILVVAQGWSDQQRRALEEDSAVFAVIPVPPGVKEGALRNAGLREARGPIVFFLEAGTRIVAPGLDGWLDAHRRGYVMVAGRWEPASDSMLAFAVLGLQPQDGMAHQAPGELPYPPTACSYARFVLHETGGFPEQLPDHGAEAINQELFRRGYLAWFDPSLRLTLPPAPSGRFDFLITRFALGRAQTRRALRPVVQSGRLLSWPLAPRFRASRSLPPFSRQAAQPEHAGWQVRVLIAAGRGAAWVGAMVEGVGAWRRGDVQLRQARPQMILRAAFADEGATALLIQCDYFQRRLTAVPVSAQLQLRLGPGQRSVSLGDLKATYRSLDPSALRQALAEAVGLDGIDYLIGQQADLDRILRPAGGQLQVVPTAGQYLEEYVKVGRLASSLQRKDIDLLQRTLGRSPQER
jgi:glycosyltransferase involved in cell wall biosynthesis